MTAYTRMELVQAVADVRHVLDVINGQVIDGHGTLVDELHARRAAGRSEHADTADDWGTWGALDFAHAADEEVLDAVIYMAERRRRGTA